jgi:pimeloyl-ACP methyl ester carboxylesterase
MSALSPVILLHGMWSTPKILNEMKASFEAKGHPVIAPRLPLHYPKNEMCEGKRKQLAQLGLNDYVDALKRDIASFMSEHSQHRPIIVGHSMGGLLAQLLAQEIQCSQLILISSAAPAGINASGWSVLKTFGHNLLKFPLWRSYTNLLLRNIQYGIANTQSADIHRQLTQDSTYESGRVTFQLALWFLFRRPPSKVNYQAIDCPVLVIGGTKDKITPIKVQHKIARKYGTKASIQVIDGACHYTVGGSFFPAIDQTIFTWLGTKQTQPSQVSKAA